MFERFLERWRAGNDPRFQAFVKGKDAFESFIQEMGVRYDEMSDAHVRRARDDTRVHIAASQFVAAIEMSETQGELADAAIAKYQLGLVRHVQGDLDAARQLMMASLNAVSSLPRRQTDHMSACHYHLGIIAQKQGRLAEAVGELRRARQMDESIGDFSGVQLCNAALTACAAGGADVEGDSPRAPCDDGAWEVPEHADSTAAEDEPLEPEVNCDPVRFDQREMMWLASYSEQANDELMAHLDTLGNEFGRPVAVFRVAYGAADASRRALRRAEPDQHLCAAILVLERMGLDNWDFQQLAFACMQRLLAVPDFRLLVYLHDLTIDELRELADHNPLVAALFDTTQIAESPSLEQLRQTLVPYLRRIGRIRAAALWRDWRLRLAGTCGNMAALVLLAAVVVSLLGFPAWLLKMNLDWLGPHGPPMASLVLGLLAFPLQSPLIFLLSRGMRTVAMAPRDNASLQRWVILGAVIMLGANHLQHSLQGPYSWIFLGLAVGVLLDSIRRAGRRARRQMVDLEAFLKRTGEPATQGLLMEVLRGEPLNPFSCPLLAAPSTRVFISYTRSSAKASRLATALHRELKTAGVSPFLDRASIPAGASWRRSLNQHLGECDAFVCILDVKGVQREWVAAELLAAVEARRLTGTPDVVILIDPAIQRAPVQMLPVFSSVTSAADDPPVQGRPQILQLNEQTQSSLAWGLAPGRFVPTSVFPRMVTLPFVHAMRLIGLVGGLGIFAGFIIGFLVMLERWGKFPLTTGLADRGWLEVTTLICAFWLGYTARATIAWGCEVDHGREMGITTPLIAAVGLAAAVAVFSVGVSPLVLGWCVVLAIAGWMMVAWALGWLDARVYATAVR